MDKQLSQKLEDGVLRLTLDSAHTSNALSYAMISQLKEALSEASKNDSVRVIVLGAKGKVFCAGHDLKELTQARENKDKGREFFQITMAHCSGLMQMIVNHRCPVIADIRAIATAAGCQLVASCDLAFASTKAQFATPGVHIGLFCSTPMVALSRNVSRKHTMEMLLTGERIDAKRAEEIGLINRVVEHAKMDDAIRELAAKITSKSSMTIETGKAAFYRQAEMNLSDAYDYASAIMVENMLKNDACEGIDAFLEKRSPQRNDS